MFSLKDHKNNVEVHVHFQREKIQSPRPLKKLPKSAPRRMSTTDFKRRLYPEVQRTTCFISVGEPGKGYETFKTVAMGVATQSPEDNMCRETGRTIALNKAIKAIIPNLPREHRPNFGNYTREALWSMFYERPKFYDKRNAFLVVNDEGDPCSLLLDTDTLDSSDDYLKPVDLVPLSELPALDTVGVVG